MFIATSMNTHHVWSMIIEIAMNIDHVWSMIIEIAMNTDHQWSLIITDIVEDQWSLLWIAVDHTWSVLINASYREPYHNHHRRMISCNENSMKLKTERRKGKSAIFVFSPGRWYCPFSQVEKIEFTRQLHFSFQDFFNLIF